MKIKQMCLAAIACVAIVSVQAAPVIEKPAIMPEAMLSVTVSDVHGFIDEFGLVAAQSSPMMNGMMLKNLLGMQLGDPGLAGIAPGKGLAIVALDTTNIFAVIEVAEAQSAAYAGIATQKGMASTYSNGLLVLGGSEEQVAKGAGLSGRVQAKLLAKRSPTLRIAAQPAAIIERNNELIQGFLQSMPALLGASMMEAPGASTNSAATTAKILEGELRVLLSMSSQCKSGEVVLAPQGGSVKINETFVPMAGTALAKLVDSPSAPKGNPKVQSGLFGDGMVLVDFMMANPAALSDFIMAETENLFKTMQIKEVDVASLNGIMTKWMKLYSGAGCETFDFDADAGMSVNYLLEVNDEAASLALLKSMVKDMEPFMKLYESMGMPMKLVFKENVREHKGIKIHHLEMDISLEEMMAEQKKQMEALKMDNMGYDIAIFDGLMLYTMGGTKIEGVIDRVKDNAATVSTVKARKVYPEGGFYYLDWDVARYMEMISAFMPDDAQSPFAPQVIALMQGVDPITSAGFRQDGRVMWSINIPGDLIAKLGQIGMMMQMQQMQQQQQGMPVQ
ncbi:hypothetical protein PDESU_02354 [Pontiella desulfatans]|uniref:5'-Nucleotidase C-terminal domain-containing protein n=1 Tax=Pontiella desulfatans TaxID=2750659 RepID=A0A6C2U1N8_PONDE|nr:hypothetical protein [Pontiella desulfatans]VGO13797.1 hypothetical protein PDESU_02354 [Pontiella desulfatans]